MGRACSINGTKRNEYRFLGGKAEEQRSLERPRHRWVDNTKMYLTVILLDGMD
jgi:hypothetical protein